MLKPLRKDQEYNEFVKDFYRKVEDYDWNDVTDNWRGLESILHRQREKKVRELLGKYRQPGRYLDVGCGTGLVLRHLPLGSVGIDLNPRHLARAGRYVPSATLQIGDAEKLQFPNESFSVAVCTEVLEHLVYPEMAVAEIGRVLKLGGLFIGTTPKKSWLWRFRWLSSTHYHNEPFHNEYEKQELEQLFAGWTIVELGTIFFRSSFFFVLKK